MGNVEIPNWLKALPLAPEYHPTDTEFADPIAYISKIEKEASAFGICKIIPPLPKPSKKYVFSNLNKSLLKCPELVSDVDLSSFRSTLKSGCGDGGNDGEVRAVFTTRHQELGQSTKRTKGALSNPQLGVHKQVWQSGEVYTLEQFEAKSKAFARSLLGMIKEASPLVIETLFWKTASEKPIYVEYANDVPGSGFGEPEGQFRYFHRRRRKRASYRRRRESSDGKQNGMDSVKNVRSDNETKATPTKNDGSMSLEMPMPSTTSATLTLDEASQSTRRKIVNSTSDREGTAGWKLSNSPWNLQVIARSPGSLTRFMPDDIPGVTSPMIYIAMLFSWFAWHVEDHELHSMNFLHMGSPKTWYAVPGDYALAFEEVIRTQVYGGNVDRLAALTLLGEKTTLLSPEIVVASGIPCCRLIQNPGEFVVTFPRAYHIGFSHGFNCGEAANFGTPQWLKVAKEAAVRRAAMNYLPMLSHQQLLYLLTMSFVSRVPRSLLPGARSSRLRDRQKEERELLVKKAFIEDILNENKTLSILLGKKATYRIVSWDPDLLPCQSKESPMAGVIAAVSTAPVENVSQVHSGNNNSNRQNNLLEEMSLYMETLNDLYLDDDDLLNDFQVDSGTLACVACGILGFPFMAVIQPSERALIELLADHPFDQGKPIASESCNSHFSPEVGCSSTGFLSGDPVPVHSVPIKQIPTTSLIEFNSGCNISSKYRRPRIFCLEHTVQIEEMMCSKGGAEVLVICHRDYQKIKAHARTIAEEIGSPFNYNEFPLESASQQDLGLIDLAIDDEEHEECGEDWTSKLGINLRYCVNVRKNSPSKQVQHALALGGLFSDKDPNSNFLNIRWQSRRSRTKVKLNHASSCEPYRSTEIKMDDQSLQKLDGMTVKKEEKIIQYSRRKKLKPGSSTKSNRLQGYPEKHIEEVSAAVYGEFENHNKNTSEINLCNDGSSISSRLGFSPVGMFPMQHENLKHDANADVQLNSSPLQVAEALATASSAVGSRGQSENQTSDVLDMEGKSGNLATCIGSEVNNEIKFTEGTCMKNGSVCAEKCSRPHVIAAHERIEMPNKDHSMENIDITGDGCHLVSVEHSKVPGDGDRLMNNVPVQVNSATLQGTDLRLGSLEAEMEHIVHEESCMNHDVCGSATSDKEVQRETVVTCTSKGEGHKLCSHALIDQQPASIGESCSPREGCAAECICDDATLKDKLQEEVSMSSGSEQTLMFSTIRLVNHPSSISLEESSEVPREPCAAPERCKEVTVDNKVQRQGTQTTRKEELVLSSSMPMEVDQPSVTSDECSEVPRGLSAEEDLCPDVTLDTSRQQDNQTTKVTEAGKLVSSSNLQMRETQLTSASAEVCCEVSKRTLANENLSGDVTRDNEVNECNPNSTPSNEEVPVCSPSTPVDQPSPAPVQNCSGIQRDTCSTENVCNKSKVSLLQDSGELENVESTMVHLQSRSGRKRKRKGQVEQKNENKLENDGFIRSPCEGLRPRVRKDATSKSGSDISKMAGEKLATRRVTKPLNVSGPQQGKKEIGKGSHKCDIEGCRMSFETKEELRIHKRNRCPYEGCGKKFRVHKYAMLHQRVHDDDRPFKCPWKGCSMTFKWAWARTEHIRVHTGERPYRCEVEGCGLSFRFVSDISRHRRKTGHYVN